MFFFSQSLEHSLNSHNETTKKLYFSFKYHFISGTSRVISACNASLPSLNAMFSNFKCKLPFGSVVSPVEMFRSLEHVCVYVRLITMINKLILECDISSSAELFKLLSLLMSSFLLLS